jgi:hypothetical protein
MHEWDAHEIAASLPPMTAAEAARVATLLPVPRPGTSGHRRAVPGRLAAPYRYDPRWQRARGNLIREDYPNASVAAGARREAAEEMYQLERAYEADPDLVPPTSFELEPRCCAACQDRCEFILTVAAPGHLSLKLKKSTGQGASSARNRQPLNRWQRVTRADTG